MSAERQSSIQVLDRAMLLLQTIAAQPDAANLKYLSAHTQLHTSTTFRILAALQAHGWIERDERGYYRVGGVFRRMAGHAAAAPDLRDAARPVMEQLRDQVGETVNLTVREGDEVVYIERAAPNRMMRVEQVIGSRAPLHMTAVGKLMLGELGADACTGYARRTGLPRYTVNTITKASVLKKCTAECAQHGYAYDNEEAELGVGCIGTLIRDANGHVLAGLSISAPIERRRDAWIVSLQQAAKQISRRLG